MLNPIPNHNASPNPNPNPNTYPNLARRCLSPYTRAKRARLVGRSFAACYATYLFARCARFLALTSALVFARVAATPLVRGREPDAFDG